MSSKKIIAVDVDDVLADSTENLRLRVNKKLGVSIGPEEYKVAGPYWSYYEHVWQKNDVKHLVKLEELETEMENDQSHILPMLGANSALTQLAKKFEIVLVTSRNPSWAKATEAWINTHFSGVFKDIHVLGSKKYQGEGVRSKGEVCKEVGASWLIDDNPEHCLSAIEHGTDAVLFGEYGWHFNAPDHLVRCKDWQAVLEYFNAQPK